MVMTQMALRTTLLHIDHMNDSQGYLGKLRGFASQLNMGGVILFPMDARPRPRHIFAVLDGDPSSTREFLKRLRTENVDVNIRGAP